MTTITTLLLRGAFTVEEFNELAALFRKFDDNQPDRVIELCAVDPTNTALEVAEQILNGAVPERADRITTFARWTR
jgi:hypothetical protein